MQQPILKDFRPKNFGTDNFGNPVVLDQRMEPFLTYDEYGARLDYDKMQREYERQKAAGWDVDPIQGLGRLEGWYLDGSPAFEKVQVTWQTPAPPAWKSEHRTDRELLVAIVRHLGV